MHVETKIMTRKGLLCHERQKSKESCMLDRFREFSLILGGNTSALVAHDLTIWI